MPNLCQPRRDIRGVALSPTSSEHVAHLAVIASPDLRGYNLTADHHRQRLSPTLPVVDLIQYASFSKRVLCSGRMLMAS